MNDKIATLQRKTFKNVLFVTLLDWFTGLRGIAF